MLTCLSAVKPSHYGGLSTLDETGKTSLVLKTGPQRQWEQVWIVISSSMFVCCVRASRPAFQFTYYNLDCVQKESSLQIRFLYRSLQSLCAYHASKSPHTYLSNSYHSTIFALFCSSAVLQLMLTIKQDSQLLNLNLCNWHRVLCVSVSA